MECPSSQGGGTAACVAESSTLFKNLHTFFLVSWSVHPLKAQVLPIAVKTGAARP